jgi:hypothetical protein
VTQRARDAAPLRGLMATTWDDRSFRFLVLVLALAVPVLWHAGRDQWFFLDEWDFLLRRDLGRPGTLLDAWFGHNVVLPAVAYRAVFEVWGVSTYRPYQLLGIAGHYAAVLLVWATARRLGVRGWLAASAVLPLVVLGSGRVNILFGFQIAMTAALALSLAHLLLADHDGPWSRRDTVGIVCGAAALLCSGVAVAGTIGVGVAVLLRRGPARAAAHAVPLGVGWATWYLLAPRRGLDATTTFDRGTIDFLISLPKAALGGLGGFEAAAYGLGALVVLGVVTAGRRAWRGPTRPARRAGVALLAGCVTIPVAFAVLVAVQRLGEGHRGPKEGRYVYIIVALAIPLLALGLEAVARYRRVLVALPLLLLFVGVPGNVRNLDEPIFWLADKDMVVALVRSDQLDTSPAGRLPWLHDRFGIRSTAELRDLAGMPGMPEVDGVAMDLRLYADTLLGLHPGPHPAPDCRRLRHDHRRLERGDTIDFTGTLAVTAVDGSDRSVPVEFHQMYGSRLTASGPLSVDVVAMPYSYVFVCSS